MIGTAILVGIAKAIGLKGTAAKVTVTKSVATKAAVKTATAKTVTAKAGTAKGKSWIAAAIKRPGQLHRDLGIPLGKKIPPHMIKAAAKNPAAYAAKHKLAVAPVKLGQRARFALLLSKMRKTKV